MDVPQQAERLVPMLSCPSCEKNTVGLHVKYWAPMRELDDKADVPLDTEEAYAECEWCGWKTATINSSSEVYRLVRRINRERRNRPILTKLSAKPWSS